MNVLAIGAHFDDVEIGCGGSLIRLGQEGNNISLYVATKSGYNDPNGLCIRKDEDAEREGFESACFLSAKLFKGNFPTFTIEANELLHSSLLQCMNEVKPDLVFVHHPKDTHHDHRVLSQALIHTARKISRVLFYESNFYQKISAFNPGFYFEITNQFDEKMKLIRIHESEFLRAGKVWEKYIRTTAELYGLKAGVDYAEGFEVYKWKY